MLTRWGCESLGETIVQEFEGKAPAVADLTDARFHLIGHLQSNKAGARRSCSR